jgi:hypothetical protein
MDVLDYLVSDHSPEMSDRFSNFWQIDQIFASPLTQFPR